jgi:predicted alpha/beta-hydrolase family hydrolase
MSRELKIPFQKNQVSALLDLPEGKPKAALTLAHGAGAGMGHKFLAELAAALARAGIAVLRFQFPYMEEGRRMPDGPKVAVETVAGAIRVLAKEVPGVLLFAAGKSFGCRMSTTAA